MSRSSKSLRVVSAFLLLFNFAGLFIPLTTRTQKNYPTLAPTQLDILKCLFQNESPFKPTMTLTGDQSTWIVLLIALPLLLSVLTFIVAATTNGRQLLSFFMTIVIMGLYVVMYKGISILWVEAIHGQVYEVGKYAILNMLVTGLALLIGLIAVIVTPKKVDKKSFKTAQGQAKGKESRDQKLQQAYDNKQQKEAEAVAKKAEAAAPVVKAYVPGSAPRGVMVGLTGMYAGAEIPFTPGDTIALGRSKDNDLIFDGQPKVSRNHCKITWDAEKKCYLFFDISTNGTFVNDSSECLPQNLEMMITPGTVIALGDENNKFRLE